MTDTDPDHVLGETDHVLTGGNATAVVRRGDTVLRESGDWTPAVHRLLRHLEAAGVNGVPRVLGIADDGREVLSFVPGECAAYPLPAHVWTVEVLDEVARFTRRLHDASLGCDQAGAWRSQPVEPAEVICHVDIAPYNTCFDADGRVVGMIDFDYATPAPRLWDLAHAAYRFAPLTTGDSTDGFTLDERLARVQRMVSIYGLEVGLAEVLEVMIQRVSGLERHATEASARLSRPDLLDHAALYRSDAAFLTQLLDERVS